MARPPGGPAAVDPGHADTNPAAATIASSGHVVDHGPLRVDTLAVPGDQPLFVLRGADPSRPVVGVFLHGLCGHGLGYLQSFAHAAAEAGPFVALQGDVPCGQGALRSWSHDLRAIDHRIDEALNVYLEGKTPQWIVLVGSSQGADRAIALARAFPDKYRQLILSSGSAVQPAYGLSRLKAAYLLVGQNENQQPSIGTERAWRRAGLPVRLRVIERAGHADFAGRGDDLMREAFRFLGALELGEAIESTAGCARLLSLPQSEREPH